MQDIERYEVSHELFKGHLLAAHQIEESSRNRKLVYETEMYFKQWMQQIEGILLKGQEIRRNSSNDGLADELDYWRKMLSKYVAAREFSVSRPFQNHLKCLKLSKSKLILVNHEILFSLFKYTENPSFQFRNGII